MIEWLKLFGTVIGAMVTFVGLIGGLFTIFEQIRHFRKLQRPLGNRGTQFLMLSREDSSSHSIAEFLVADDLMHFLSSFNKGSNKTIEVEHVGEFYRVKMQFPPGVLDTVTKVKKKR